MMYGFYTSKNTYLLDAQDNRGGITNWGMEK